MKALRDREAREKKALALGLPPKGSSWARIAEAMHATTTTTTTATAAAAVTATTAAAADR